MSSTIQAPGADVNSATGNSLHPPSLRERVRQATRQIESRLIIEALEQHRWNRRRTAEALGISYRLLMYKMKSCNLRDETPAPRAEAAPE
jgi:DNA-binding NtrC family response regulator